MPQVRVSVGEPEAVFGLLYIGLQGLRACGYASNGKLQFFLTEESQLFIRCDGQAMLFSSSMLPARLLERTVEVDSSVFNRCNEHPFFILFLHSSNDLVLLVNAQAMNFSTPKSLGLLGL